MNITGHAPVVAFTLARYPRLESAHALAHLGLDRLIVLRSVSVGEALLFYQATF